MPGLEIPGEFLRHAVLDTVVPHAPAIDIEGALTSALEDGADDLPSVLSSIPQRSLLFFDESLPIRVVLRLSDCTDTILKHYLPRLEVRLDVFAVDPAETVAENPTPAREVIFSGIVDTREEPLVIFNEFEGEDGTGNHVYLIWSMETFLSAFTPR
ncbi:uncharacterized protein N7496_006502 [Penicillium cataractarum]|uniref:Uncharacterized protein n=1 Tax=Penicillium cataractarum TaxID=2100454 RepID=A0A9W9S314_9EURO|nr:uncharacterized protein N7496_006502 [Penicillium cataractarum]KAJ5370410.1 hypothetical protein N7496_006502 [Penicillium cataractarum]